MAMRTIAEFEDILQPIIVDILDWSVSKPNDVRIGWETEGPPAFKITDDVIFIMAVPIDHQINRQQDVSYDEGSPDLLETRGMTRVMGLNVIAYGADALYNLKKIKTAMFYESVRHTLSAEQIFYIPDTIEPRRAPEPGQGQWWERGDMQLQFNELLTDTREQNAVESVDIEIDRENGVNIEFTINQ